MKLQNIIASVLAAMLMLGTLGPVMAQTTLTSIKPTVPFPQETQEFSQGNHELDFILSNDAAARAAAEAEMLQKLQTSNSGPFTLEAGPIWSTNNAKQVCPRVCSTRSASWTSQWWTTVPGKMSVCQCK